MNEIRMLPIAYLVHHPENPRSDLGDLTELADSIRAQGILQNLTVIPDEKWDPDPGQPRERYFVVIGNRRFEAAKAAGLTELPCRIVRMDEQEAMRTMMSENMQRQDLTVLDQIHGIGKMQQLGMSLPEIAQGTGLSESTVRKRAKVGRLPQRELALACDKGATLLDLLEVAKLEDEEDQQRVLRVFGTNNFQYAINAARNDAERRKWRARIMPAIEKLYPKAKEIPTSEEYSGRWKEICRWSSRDEQDKPVPEPVAGEKYGLKVYDFMIILCREDKEWVKRKAEEKDQNAQLRDRKETAKALNEEAWELRASFIRRFTLRSGTEVQRFWELMSAQILQWKALTSGVGYYHSPWDALSIRKILAIPHELGRDPEETIEHELARRGVMREAFLLAWAVSGGITQGIRHDDGWCNPYNGTWKPCEALDEIYAVLGQLGYQMSDFEKSLRDQSHEFFRREAE